MRRRSLVDTLFDSKLAFGTASVLAVALGVAAVMYWQRPGEVPRAGPAHAAGWDGAIGPGTLSGAVRDLPAFGARVMPDTKIAVDDAGHLVPDLALRSLMDRYLVKVRQSDRQAMQAQLRTLLRERLRQPAAGEADRLVTDYLAYLQAEQQMLARERFTRPDPAGLSEDEVTHLLAWQKQRAALRQRMLGTAAASAWFDAEDGDCASVLDEWQKQLAPPDEGDSNEQFERRRHGDTLEARRNNNAQACAAQIAGSIAPQG